MNATITNYVPAPKSIELHLASSPEFSRYSKKVKAIGGSYSACRGNCYKRYVSLPWTDEGRALANKLIAEFGRGKSNSNRGTPVVARGVDRFRGKHVNAPIVVQYIDKSESDPCGKFWGLYEADFLRTFPEAAEPEPVVEPPKPIAPTRTIDRLAYAVRHGDQELFRELEAKWGIGQLDCIARLAEEDGKLAHDEFTHARFTFDW